MAISQRMLVSSNDIPWRIIDIRHCLVFVKEYRAGLNSDNSTEI